MLTCCAAPQTDVVIEARTVPGAGEFPGAQDAGRVMAIARPAPDVAVLTLQLPANEVLRTTPASTSSSSCATGARRSYSMANAPHTQADKPAIELHIRHMPGGKFTEHVFGAMKEKEILRLEGPFGSFFPARGQQAHRAARPAPALRPSGPSSSTWSSGITRPTVLYWGCRRKADLYLHDWAEAAAARLPNLRYVPVLSEPKPEDGWKAHRPVHQAVMADLPDLSGHQV